MMNWHFYHGKRVFVTGHTGFKGAWLCRVLRHLGAEVYGFALEPPTEPSVWRLAGLERDTHSVTGDVRDLEALQRAFREAAPELVIHMAAQPLVRESYRDPAGTYATNVMGTVHLLECLRGSDTVRSFLNVTTDKVYRNNEWEWGYREIDPLDGGDPYSNSKSCSELVTGSYQRSFFAKRGPAISTARSGNVIGGGDFAEDRIIPDCIRAASKGEVIAVRSPYSVRPYQHVLEALFAYLLILARQAEEPELAGSYNVGPDYRDCVTTGELVDLFCKMWENGSWENRSDSGPHEAGFLRLDTARLQNALGWRPVWGLETAMAKTVEWTKVWLGGGDVAGEMDRQIAAYRAGTEAWR